MKLAPVALLLAVTACSSKRKEEQPDRFTEAPRPAGSGSTTTAPPPGAKPTPKHGAELAGVYTECVGLANSGKLEDFKTKCVAGTTAYKVDPAMKVSPQLVLVSGREVLVVAVRAGKHAGSAKDVGITYFERLVFNDENKISEAHEEADGMTLLAQAGRLPPNAPPSREPSKAPEAAETVVASLSATEKTNLEVVRKANEAFNAKKTADVLAAYGDDAVESDQASAKDRSGKKEIEAGLQEVWKLMPDLKVEVPITGLYAAGDYVAVVGTMTGTYEGPMAKGTKKKVTGTYAEVVRLAGGKIVRMWRFHDGLAVARQLGFEPPPVETKKDEPAKMEAPKTEPPKTEPPKTDAPKTEPPKAAPAVAPKN